MSSCDICKAGLQIGDPATVRLTLVCSDDETARSTGDHDATYGGLVAAGGKVHHHFDLYPGAPCPGCGELQTFTQIPCGDPGAPLETMFFEIAQETASVPAKIS